VSQHLCRFGAGDWGEVACGSRPDACSFAPSVSLFFRNLKTALEAVPPAKEMRMPDLLTTISATIAAIGALGTAASGLVDASKAFNGGISNVGFGKIETALRPFQDALKAAESDWTAAIKANWVNGMPKEDQKANAKSLIRLGLSSSNAAAMAGVGHVDAEKFKAAIVAVETGAALTPEQVNILGRFNGAIDAAMDCGFERADQVYRNVAKLSAGIIAVLLAIAGGAMLAMDKGRSFSAYLFSAQSFQAILVGLIAVPLAPLVKDLTSSLQAAVGAIKATRA